MYLLESTEKNVLPPQVHMNVNTCPTPPHPNPPMCTKQHGLLKAVLQLIIEVPSDLTHTHIINAGHVFSGWNMMKLYDTTVIPSQKSWVANIYYNIN